MEGEEEGGGGGGGGGGAGYTTTLRKPGCPHGCQKSVAVVVKDFRCWSQTLQCMCILQGLAVVRRPGQSAFGHYLFPAVALLHLQESWKWTL